MRQCGTHRQPLRRRGCCVKNASGGAPARRPCLVTGLRSPRPGHTGCVRARPWVGCRRRRPSPRPFPGRVVAGGAEAAVGPTAARCGVPAGPVDGGAGVLTHGSTAAVGLPLIRHTNAGPHRTAPVTVNPASCSAAGPMVGPSRAQLVTTPPLRAAKSTVTVTPKLPLILRRARPAERVDGDEPGDEQRQGHQGSNPPVWAAARVRDDHGHGFLLRMPVYGQ